MGVFLKSNFNFIKKYFLHPLHLGHTMNLGKKIPRTIEKKFEAKNRSNLHETPY